MLTFHGQTTGYLILTDLDGTLLDEQNYEYTAARPALEKLQKRSIPLVLCSSKTAAEMRPLRRQIDNQHPFIVENGGGIYIPRGYFSKLPESAEPRGNFMVMRLGRPLTELRDALEEIKREHNLYIRSFQDMKTEELARETGLSLEQAERSLDREFDLPFRVLNSESGTARILETETRGRGLQLTSGGRFFHISGRHDKGQAATALFQLYGAHGGSGLKTVGLGDSENDLSLLKTVDIAIVIPNPKSRAPLSELLPEARKALAPGPEGWNQAILSLLDERESSTR